MAQAFQSNQGTQTNLLVDTTGGTSSSGTSIPVMKLDISALGTFTKVWDGNVQGGTIGSVIGVGSVSGLSNLPGGTLGSLLGIGAIPNIPGGTLGSLLGVGAIPNIPGGTITLATVVGKDAPAAARTGNPIPVGGTDGGGTVYAFLTDTKGQQYLGGGTVGTLLGVGVIPNVPGGTIGSVVGIGSVSGLSNIPGGTLGSLLGVGAIPNIPGGTVGSVVGIGSVSGLSNLPQGSIQVTAGTFRADARTTQNIVSYGTQMVGTAAVAATVVGSTSVGAGTSLWLQDVSITNNNANVLCVLGFGTAQQGTNVLLRHTLGTTGAVGIEKTFAKAVNAGMTNQDLVFSLGAAGTVDLSISYFISA